MNDVIRRSDGKVAVICGGAVRWYRPASLQWVNDDKWNKKCTAMADCIKPRRRLTDWERWLDSVVKGSRGRNVRYQVSIRTNKAMDWNRALFKSVEWLQIRCRMPDDTSRWDKWCNNTSSNMTQREGKKKWLLRHRI